MEEGELEGGGEKTEMSYVILAQSILELVG